MSKLVSEAVKEASPVFRAIRSARSHYSLNKNAAHSKIDAPEQFINSAGAGAREVEAAIDSGLLKRASSGHLYIQLDPRLVDRPADFYRDR